MSIDGQALRIMREKDGYTIKQMASALGISPQYLSDIEAGRRTLKRNPGLIKRMAELLNIPGSMIEHRAPGEKAS